MNGRQGFGTGRKKLLATLATLLVAGGAILLIDQWRRAAEPAPEPEVELEQIANTLGMRVVTPESQAARLLPVLQTIPALANGELALGEVLYREDDQHALWLLEYQITATLLHKPTGPVFRRHQGELTRLAIVIWRRDAALPDWDGDSRSATPDDWNQTVVDRIQRIEDLWISTRGEWLVAHARGLSFGLQEKIQRQQSKEFLPGLRNSALAIDAQRVIDVANLLSPALPALPRVYRIDVDVRLPAVRKPDIGPRLQTIREEQAAKIEAMRADIDARNAQLRERMRVDAEARRQQLQQRISASAEGARATATPAQPDSNADGRMQTEESHQE
ncbi:MAG: hypothetical protein IT475_17110 [Aquimonas sp.]|nr:hypothetical protein [Aquimonas sp.]